MVKFFLALLGFAFMLYGVFEVFYAGVWWNAQTFASLPSDLRELFQADKEVNRKLIDEIKEGLFTFAMGILMLGVNQIIMLLERNNESGTKVNFKKDLGNWPPSV